MFVSLHICTKYKFADLVFYLGTHIFVHKVFMHSMQGGVRIRGDPWGLLIQQPDQKLPTRPIRIAPTRRNWFRPTKCVQPSKTIHSPSAKQIQPVTKVLCSFISSHMSSLCCCAPLQAWASNFLLLRSAQLCYLTTVTREHSFTVTKSNSSNPRNSIQPKQL